MRRSFLSAMAALAMLVPSGLGAADSVKVHLQLEMNGGQTARVSVKLPVGWHAKKATAATYALSFAGEETVGMLDLSQNRSVIKAAIDLSLALTNHGCDVAMEVNGYQADVGISLVEIKADCGAVKGRAIVQAVPKKAPAVLTALGFFPAGNKSQAGFEKALKNVRWN